MTAHEKVSTAYAALFAKANPDESWLGLTPIAGDDNVVLFLEGFPSFAAAETSFGELGSGSHRAAAWVARGDLAARRGDHERAAELYRTAAEALQDVRF